MTDKLQLVIHIDGAARGNPGPAAYAFVISHDGEQLLDGSGLLGQTTNNVAEYTALVKALEKAAELKASTVHIHSDSELLVKQMRGEYRVKNPGLLELYREATALRRRFESVQFTHVPRGENKEADRLCNEALDGKGTPSSRPSPPVGERERTTASLRPSPPVREREGTTPLLRRSPPMGEREKVASPRASSVKKKSDWEAVLTAAEGVLREAGVGEPKSTLERIVGLLKEGGFLRK